LQSVEEKRIQGSGNGRLEFIQGVGGGLSQMSLEFRESQFNRIEVGAVGRQIAKAHTVFCKKLTHALNLVCGESLAKGDKVELRNFGVFDVKMQRARIGRNPRRPETDVPIPSRTMVKFTAGKEMRTEVLKLTPHGNNHDEQAVTK